ncbi:hypothetical protein LTR36_004096 [Oleoguttula mirabilis]|uniref:Pentatricopeptide repeat-containing protein-mitochondrial domain-containing protein n=1 Tax=Oleoguttula mirabilis TaxID=1507867 RepID=A0AAV9JI22_9PEZI|nr:hypothetical protein LTR36_004096 [Oleoguttula mirabilis]
MPMLGPEKVSSFKLQLARDELEMPMPPTKLAIDPLWQCLCPSWTQAAIPRARRVAAQSTRPIPRCVKRPPPPHAQQRHLSTQIHSHSHAYAAPTTESTAGPKFTYVKHAVSQRGEAVHRREHALGLHRNAKGDNGQDLRKEPTPYLYSRLRALAIGGKVRECRVIAELLIKERKEKPNVQLYNALIHSNVSHDEGAAWRVSEYLEEMREAGLQPDTGTCHVVLKVLSVHPDHLLRTDTLEYMKARWFQLNEDGAHEVAAGLLREGLFEQGLEKLDAMRREGVRLHGWLQDMAVYMLSAAGEVEEAYRIMRLRYDGGEIGLSRTVWYTLLDAGSSYRHHPSTSLIWNSQVNAGYLNPSTGICLNVLTTAAQAGDAVLATDVFSHLSKRGTAFQPIHYQLLLECYLSTTPPDLKRALSILTIMTLEKLDISLAETRALYLHLRSQPALVAEAFATLRELHEQGRKIPIAALNLIIECYVQQRNLAEAMKVYKLIHTFVPMAEGAKKTFANIETFNLLLRGCRLASPPDEGLASFLVSELLALRIKPTVLTYDRLILVFVEAASHALKAASTTTEPTQAQAQRAKSLQLSDWAFRHFIDMQAVSASARDHSHDHPSNDVLGLQQKATLGWMPRFGTVERLATQLAKVGDRRCWDVLQAGEDQGGGVDGWEAKGKWVRRNVEEAWERAAKADHARGGEAFGGRLMGQEAEAAGVST